MPRTPVAAPVPSYAAQLERLATLATEGVLDPRGLAALEGLRAVAEEAEARAREQAVPPTGPGVEPAPGTADLEAERIPALAVVTAAALPTDEAMARVQVRARAGRVDMTPLQPRDFAPIEGTEPPADAYLLVDVDLGARFRGVTPEAALVALGDEGRTPLTIHEGVSLLVQLPDALVARTAFSLLASRRADQRVPALWTSARAPRLGWCWDRNPHSWLGSASAARRVGPPRPGS